LVVTPLYCKQTLHFPTAGTLTLQASEAENVCTTATNRLFITDKTSKRRFLIDTGSDLCVYPRQFIPQRRSRVNYDLCAANGTTIPTYGGLSPNLNLGLRREFTWRFIIADVTQPLIGADFLTHFGLLVDCRNNRQLDNVISLSTPAQAVSLRISSIKVIKTGTSLDALLSEFPDLIRPTGIQRDVRHNTVHHIRTTPGPPITCRPRRLAPDGLPRVLGPRHYTSCPRRTTVGVPAAIIEHSAPVPYLTAIASDTYTITHTNSLDVASSQRSIW
jgi:hypothetical protein